MKYFFVSITAALLLPVSWVGAQTYEDIDALVEVNIDQESGEVTLTYVEDGRTQTDTISFDFSRPGEVERLLDIAGRYDFTETDLPVATVQVIDRLVEQQQDRFEEAAESVSSAQQDAQQTIESLRRDGLDVSTLEEDVARAQMLLAEAQILQARADYEGAQATLAEAKSLLEQVAATDAEVLKQRNTIKMLQLRLIELLVLYLERLQMQV